MFFPFHWLLYCLIKRWASLQDDVVLIMISKHTSNTESKSNQNIPMGHSNKYSMLRKIGWKNAKWHDIFRNFPIYSCRAINYSSSKLWKYSQSHFRAFEHNTTTRPSLDRLFNRFQSNSHVQIKFVFMQGPMIWVEILHRLRDIRVFADLYGLEIVTAYNLM